MSEQKIIIQQNLGRTQGYQELWPKTDCYTKEETNQLIQTELPSVDWQIGDVRTTAKNDLSDNWVLCNGSIIESENYPQLLKYLGDNGPYLYPETLYSSINIGTYRFLNDRIYYNGNYVLAYMANNAVGILYGSSLNRTLTSKTVVSVGSYRVYNLQILVNNGVFCVSFLCNSKLYSYFSTDLETWSTPGTYSLNSTDWVQASVLNGKWVFLTRFKIYYSSEAIPTSFTLYSFNYPLLGINYFNEKYWLVVLSSNEVSYGSFSDIDNISNELSLILCSGWVSSAGSYKHWGKIFKKDDGYYLVYTVQNSNNVTQSGFSFVEDLTSNSFSTKTDIGARYAFVNEHVKEIDQGIFLPNQVSSTGYGGYILGNQKCISLSGDVYAQYWANIKNTNLGCTYSSSTRQGLMTVTQYTYVNNTCQLPSITVDKAKAYIKVK